MHFGIRLRVQYSALFGRRHRDPHPLARITGKTGEHRLHQVRDDRGQVAVARLRLRAAFEQALAGRGAVDGKVEVAGIDGVARHLIVPAASEAAPHEWIVPAGDIAPPMATAHDHRAIEAAAVPTAVPGMAKTGRADDALDRKSTRL